MENQSVTEKETQLFAKAPKVFKGCKYKGLSAGAKLLYTWGLDRLQISKLNHKFDGSSWYDFTYNQHFIFYSVENVMKDMCCSKPTAISLRKELETFCLWEMIDQGKNKPTKIFVKEIIPSQVNNNLKYNKNLKRKLKEVN
jgi:hypothetical protein